MKSSTEIDKIDNDESYHAAWARAMSDAIHPDIVLPDIVLSAHEKKASEAAPVVKPKPTVSFVEPLSAESASSALNHMPEFSRLITTRNLDARKLGVEEVADFIAMFIQQAKSIYEVMGIVEAMEKYSDTSILQPELEALRGKHCKSSGLCWKGVPVSSEWINLIKQAKEKIMEFIRLEKAKKDSNMQFDQTVHDFLNAPTSKAYSFFHLDTHKSHEYRDTCHYIRVHATSKAVEHIFVR